MAFKVGDMVRIKDIRDRNELPLEMRLLSGQNTFVLDCCGKVGSDENYYELSVDCGESVWPDYLLESADNNRSDDEWIESVLKLIADIEGKLDQLKRQLWRRKKYGDR